MSRELTFWLLKVIPTIQYAFLFILTVCAIIVGHKRRVNNDIHLVYLNSALVPIGLIGGMIVNSTIMFVHFYDGWSVGSWSFFEVFFYVCIAMMLAYLNETTKYDSDGFVTSNFLGIKRQFDYVDITGISYFYTTSGSNTTLYFGRKKARVDAMAIGGDSFVVQAKKAYYQLHNKEIPRHRPKIDPMNGNLENPWLYFLMALFLIVVSSFSFLWISHALRPADNSLPSDAEERMVSFYYYEYYEKRDCGTWLLYTTVDEKAFSLAWLDGYEISLPIPETLCKGGVYSVIVHKWKKPYVNSKYEILAISTADGRQIISAFDRNTAYRNTQLIAGIIGGIALAVCVIVGFLVIVIGRHPERFSRKIRNKFYKKDDWLDPEMYYKNIIKK